MRNFSGFKMICSPSVHGNNLLQLCIAGKVLLLGQYTMASQEKCQNLYEIELPQSIIDSFARFLAPEIQKLYASEEGRKELETWKSILIKVRREVKFKDNMQRDALFWGIPFYCSNEEECFVP